MRRKTGILHSLRLRGFDRSYVVPFERGAVARCSQCEALCINGHPTHETGCPNSTHECRGCGALLPANQSYCTDCSY